MDKFFKISERGSTVGTEIIGGLTTFFAMAYIVVTNPNQVTGFAGLSNIWNAVYIASIIAAVIGTLLMGLYARLPFAQACGMGLNSFFFVTFILPQLISGGDVVEGYQAGLVIILLSGLVFLFLSATGAREYIAKSMPECLKKAIPAGIGLFIAFIGLQNAGIIKDNPYVLVQFFDFHGVISSVGTDILDDAGNVIGTVTAMDAWKTIAPVIIAIVGVLMIAVLSKFKVKGNILISIAACTVLYYVSIQTMPSFDLNKIGETFKDFSDIGITGVFHKDSWTNAFSPEYVGGVFSAIMLIVTFCIVDMFDTIGTLYGTATQAGMLDKNGDPIDVNKAMLCDSTATVAGAIAGTSTCTTFVESSAGVAVGARTGLASVITALCFIVCLVLSPLASIVPACATAPALIFVGVLMLKNFANVDMDDMRSAVPAFLALVMMPLTYSIANGIGIGAIAYVLISIFTGKFTKKDIVITGVAILFVLKFIFVTM